MLNIRKKYLVGIVVAGFFCSNQMSIADTIETKSAEGPCLQGETQDECANRIGCNVYYEEQMALCTRKQPFSIMAWQVKLGTYDPLDNIMVVYVDLEISTVGPVGGGQGYAAPCPAPCP